MVSLQHVIGKRTCTIAQAGLWMPIIKGMISELCSKIDPYFQKMLYPPCVSDGKFKECVVKIENERRVDGRDSIPPCSLYMNYEPNSKWHSKNASQVKRYYLMRKQYGELWGRDPDTFEEVKNDQ